VAVLGAQFYEEYAVANEFVELQNRILILFLCQRKNDFQLLMQH